MYGVEMYGRVRLACHQEELSQREESRQFGIDRKTVRKMLMFSVPPGYQRRKSVGRDIAHLAAVHVYTPMRDQS